MVTAVSAASACCIVSYVPIGYSVLAYVARTRLFYVKNEDNEGVPLAAFCPAWLARFPTASFSSCVSPR